MSIRKMGDQDLVVLYLDGNEQAFEVLLLRHKNKVFRFIYSKVKDIDLANDLFQDTFIKIINTIKLGNYNEEGKFLPWVMRIANNLIIDYFRKNNKMKFLRENTQVNENFSIFSLLKAEDDNVLISMSKLEIEVLLKKLILLLPDDQKEIIQFRLYDELSFKEIAEIKDLSINTVLGRMRYAVLNLRKLVKEHSLVLEI